LFQNISFPTGRCYEDIGTLCFVIEKANKICYLNQALYYYYYRGGSISKNPGKKEIEDRVRMLYRQYQFMKEHSYSIKDEVYFRALNTAMRFLVCFGMPQDQSFKEIVDQIIRLCRFADWKKLSKKRKLICKMYRVSPKMVEIPLLLLK
jgi:hypothetical protein